MFEVEIKQEPVSYVFSFIDIVYAYISRIDACISSLLNVDWLIAMLVNSIGLATQEI